MKKLFALLVSVAMTLSMAVVASAADPTIDIQINGGAGDSAYYAYKLLDITTNAVDATADDYHVNSKYLAALQAATGETSEADIIAYIGALTAADDIREFANDVYAEILDNSIAKDYEVASNASPKLFDNVAEGYYLIAEAAKGSSPDSYSLVMLDTASEKADTDDNGIIVINTKEGVPSLEKKVKETNDTTGVVSGWQDGADYDVDDEVPFKLTATLPYNYAEYSSYNLVFHDEQSAGLTFNASTVVVKVDGTTVDSTKYQVVTTGLTSPETFKIVIDDLMTAVPAADSDSEITVEYTSTVNSTAVIGGIGNPNVAYLEFSNNPYDTDDTDETPEDKVAVFTYELDITKVDSSNQALPGAGFTLYKEVPATTSGAIDMPNTAKGTYTGKKFVVVGTFTTTASDAVLEWYRIDSGNYVLVETTVPANYNQANDIVFTATATYDIDDADPSLDELESSNDAITLKVGSNNGILEGTVVNQYGGTLPSTGGVGTTIFYTVGAILFLGAGVMLITKKRMSVEA